MSLTKEAILEAAYETIRRHGPSKATVVDVAAALGVSHGSIYRFFPTKAALREAVVGAWLNRTVVALEATPLVGSAPERLRAWFDTFQAIKRAQRAQSPELFEAFRVLSSEEPTIIAAYKGQLTAQIAEILASGVSTGEFTPLDPGTTARALLTATLRFHHPKFARDWDDPGLAADFETLWSLLIRSIRSERNSPL